MLVAYILGKDRLWRKHLLFGNKQIFHKDETDYEIHSDAVYWYRFMGFKLARRIDFKQGCKEPLVYDGIVPSLSTSMFSLDEAAYIIGKAMKGLLITLAVIFSAVACFGVIVLLVKSFGMMG